MFYDQERERSHLAPADVDGVGGVGGSRGGRPTLKCIALMLVKKTILIACVFKTQDFIYILYYCKMHFLYLLR